MKKSYRFTISGNGTGGHTFETSGVFVCEFHETFDRAMKETFDKLTSGQAVYGSPGVGCKGPYDIRRVLIEQLVQ